MCCIGQQGGNKWAGRGERGQLIGHEWISSRKSLVTKLSRYDLLLGVVKAEAFLAFTGEDVQYGIEPDRRTNILRTFVKSTYRLVKNILSNYEKINNEQEFLIYRIICVLHFHLIIG